ncbi:MAG: hypothetical protein QXF12_01720 [Candidatus Aenigmatarchaeota archaeon]
MSITEAVNKENRVRINAHIFYKMLKSVINSKSIANSLLSDSIGISLDSSSKNLTIASYDRYGGIKCSTNISDLLVDEKYGGFNISVPNNIAKLLLKRIEAYLEKELENVSNNYLDIEFEENHINIHIDESKQTIPFEFNNIVANFTEVYEDKKYLELPVNINFYNKLIKVITKGADETDIFLSKSILLYIDKDKNVHLAGGNRSFLCHVSYKQDDIPDDITYALIPNNLQLDKDETHKVYYSDSNITKLVTIDENLNILTEQYYLNLENSSTTVKTIIEFLESLNDKTPLAKVSSKAGPIIKYLSEINLDRFNVFNLELDQNENKITFTYNSMDGSYHIKESINAVIEHVDNFSVSENIISNIHLFYKHFKTEYIQFYKSINRSNVYIIEVYNPEDGLYYTGYFVKLASFN